MDISENAFDSQQTGGGVGGGGVGGQAQQQQQQTPQSHVLPGQQMQCDPIVSYAQQQLEGNHGPLGGPIPLPAPPQSYDKGRSTAADIDFDSLLLQQFSCMGTRDHDDLIEQFHSLMNNQMNKDAARFFLEMSNW